TFTGATAHIAVALLAFALIAEPSSLRAADPPIRVLLLSGQNNHDWKTTTPKLKAILTNGGHFAVDVTERPEQCTAETLAQYDLIVSDWNAWGDAKVKEWPPAMREAFLGFVSSGKGYVSIHAGSSSFYDWPEYHQIGGLFWNLDETSHGPPHEFTVEFTRDHPITRASSRLKPRMNSGSSPVSIPMPQSSPPVISNRSP
ncbi:MAG TPA: ThuA domain-containing protein, partial [Verrucomicrobiota bacterium]|nr:ThuA domain-containing protein [Verrucomicrobiota bacterium]